MPNIIKINSSCHKKSKEKKKLKNRASLLSLRLKKKLNIKKENNPYRLTNRNY